MTAAVVLVHIGARGSRETALRALAGLAIVAVAVFGLVDFAARVPPYKEIAEILRPYTAQLPPTRLAFVSPTFKVPQLYLHRKGRYWSSYYVRDQAADLMSLVTSGEVCAFVVGPEEEANPDLATVRD